MTLPQHETDLPADAPTPGYRLSSETPNFPYGYPGLVCYMRIVKGALEQIRTRADIREAARSRVKIYAVWPGQYRSDLFLVDDHKALRAAVKA